MRIGALIGMVPDDIQDLLLQQADVTKDYKSARDKLIGLTDA